MVFYYNNKTYEVSEMVDIGGYPSSGILVLFELRYSKFVDGKKIWCSSCDEDACQEMRFINYFYQDNWTQEELVEECKYFIDHEYDKEFDECKFLLMNMRKALKEFDDDIKANNNTKSSLDRLEFAQGDLMEYVEQNIPLALDQNDD